VTPYARPFTLTARAGNNAFAWDRRGSAPRLHVPSLIDGAFDDVRPGHDVVFEDIDEHDVLRSCAGLAHFVRTTWRGVPTVVMDNHNHAFYFWCEAWASGLIAPGATLVHIDQHKDMRLPDHPMSGTPDDPGFLEAAFRYTNETVNVGNYVVPAREMGLVGDLRFVTSGAALYDTPLPAANTILNIDLDYFAPEMAYIPFDEARRFIHAHLATAALVTIATSPFFIDQALAVETLRRLA
jgi:hypothetical protein